MMHPWDRHGADPRGHAGTRREPRADRSPDSARVRFAGAGLVAISLLTSPAPALAQDARSLEPGHLEHPDQAPATATPSPSPPGPPPIVSTTAGIQVNVDASGHNVRGDAANEPSLAVDPRDPTRIVIAWRQFATVTSNFREAGMAVSHDGGRHFQNVGPLEPGVFRSDPVLAADANGGFYFYSLRSSFTCDLFRSATSGLSWSAPQPAQGGDKAWMAVDPAGDAPLYFSWSITAGCCGSRVFTRSVDGGASFLTPITLPESPLWGTLAVGPDRELYIAGFHGRTFDRSTFAVDRSLDAWVPGVTPTFRNRALVNPGGTLAFAVGPNPAGLLGQVWIAVNGAGGPDRGHVYLLASVDPPGPDPLDVHFLRSTDGGATWSAPIRVNDDAPGAWQWFATMSIAPNGRLDAVWNDTRDHPGGLRSHLYTASSTDGGLSWTTNRALTAGFAPKLGYPNQNKIGDYYHMVSDDVGAHLAYAATFQGEQDVYYLRIGEPDCNGNGVADPVDIARGTSSDLNADGVPDECQGLLLIGPDPGLAGTTNQLWVTRATPRAPVWFFASLDPIPVSLIGPTRGFVLHRPVFLGAPLADPAGHATLLQNVPPALAGTTVAVQAIEPTSHRISDAVVHRFP